MPDRSRTRLLAAATIVLVVAAAAVRFYRLGDHFSHVDELVTIAGPLVVRQGLPFEVDVPLLGTRIVDSDGIRRSPMLYAAYISTTTYAPVQYAVYPFVVGKDYGYREYLVRGRAPSALASAAAVAAFCLFCASYFRQHYAATLIPVALFACSLMHITYAQQAMPYSAGVLGTALMLLLVHKWAIGTGRLWTLALALAAIGYTNYQVLAMTPVALCATAVARWVATNRERRREAYRAAVAFALLLILIAPGLTLAMMRDSPGRLEVVPGFSTYFPRPPDGVIAASGYYPVFVARGLVSVVEANLLVALDSTLATWITYAFAGCATVGLAVLAFRRDAGSRALALMLIGICTMWVTLNLLRRFPLGPSRHVLSVAPFILFAGAVGLQTVLRRLPRMYSAFLVAAGVATIAFLFVSNYSSFLRERSDKFSEQAIDARLRQHGLDTIVTYRDTWQPALMFRTRPVRPAYLDLDAIVRKGAESRTQLPGKSVLLVSQYGLPHDFPEIKAELDARGFRVVPLDAVSSDVEPGVTRAIKWGTNGYYVSLGIKESK